MKQRWNSGDERLRETRKLTPSPGGHYNLVFATQSAVSTGPPLQAHKLQGQASTQREPLPSLPHRYGNTGKKIMVQLVL
ncbi:MAG: hypothetical protein O7E51_16275 [Acidobacteria bacterium]|nr:hypothetical protein [Acidobacteriota bacterium]